MSWLLLKHLLSNPNHKGEFIGMGNLAPDHDANILFVGQECAIDVKNPGRTKAEISDNWDEWYEIINHIGGYGNRTFNECFNGTYYKIHYNVPYTIEHNPQVGQKYMQNNKTPLPPFSLLKKMRARINPKYDRGLGATWYNYAKILESVNGKQYSYNNGCDFFNDCFMTELSDKSAANHTETISNETNDAKRNRTGENGILRDPFFQDFDIVICAAGSYMTQAQYQNLFSNARILIITQQLSRMSNSLQLNIANIIRNNKPGVFIV